MIIIVIAIGLIAWVAVLSLTKPTPLAGLVLFVCQIPFLVAVTLEVVAGKMGMPLVVLAILDIAFAGIAWVLFLVKKKNQG